jgi:DICT domain-containing protein
MSLSELIAGVEAHERTITVVNPSPGTVESLRERFAARNVTVVPTTAAAGPTDYAVLGDGEQFLGAVAVESVVEPDDDDRPYGPILDRLDETMFTAYDRDRMLSASREIEDRAWRVGSGELHACFQRLGNVERQRETYERLAGAEGLSVHAYAVPPADRDPRAVAASFDGVRLHLEDCAELRRSWVVAFDGGGVPENECALVAEERDGGFYGFWTYDPTTVDYAIEHLRRTYLANGDGDGDGDRSARSAGP